jgi:hypothetical protein
LLTIAVGQISLSVWRGHELANAVVKHLPVLPDDRFLETLLPGDLVERLIGNLLQV